MYNPHYQKPHYVQTNWGQRQSDKILGTNYGGRADAENRQRAMEAAQNNAYEFQKAVNINKYSWNQQGMVEAGINPLAASGNIGSVSAASQGQSAGGMSQGGVGEMSESLDVLSFVKDILHEVSNFRK